MLTRLSCLRFLLSITTTFPMITLRAQGLIGEESIAPAKTSCILFHICRVGRASGITWTIQRVSNNMTIICNSIIIRHFWGVSTTAAWIKFSWFHTSIIQPSYLLIALFQRDRSANKLCQATSILFLMHIWVAFFRQ